MTEKYSIQDHKKSYLFNPYYSAEEFQKEFWDLKNADQNSLNNDSKIAMQIRIEMEVFGFKKVPKIYQDFVSKELWRPVAVCVHANYTSFVIEPELY